MTQWIHVSILSHPSSLFEYCNINEVKLFSIFDYSLQNKNNVEKQVEGKTTYLVSASFCRRREQAETRHIIRFLRWECTKLGEGDT
jgi:hypothetical protein